MKKFKLLMLSRINLLLVVLIGLLGAGCSWFAVDYGSDPNIEVNTIENQSQEAPADASTIDEQEVAE